MSLGLAERLFSDCIVSGVKLGAEQIMVYGYFSEVGLGLVVPVKETLNISAYQGILDWCYWLEMFQTDCVSVQNKIHKDINDSIVWKNVTGPGLKLWNWVQVRPSHSTSVSALTMARNSFNQSAKPCEKPF